MVLHFAYGSNMSRALMEARCPNAQPLGTVRLDGYRYVITRDGYASIVSAPGRHVHGVLWQLGCRDLAALKAYEQLDGGLCRIRMIAVRFRGRLRRALIYLGRDGAPGKPRPGYQDRIVLPAAREWNFPESYLAELGHWVRGGAR